MTLHISQTGPISHIAEDGHTTLYAPGAWVGGVWQATSLSDLPAAVQEAAGEHWTPALVSAYRDASQPVEPTPDELIEAYRAAIQAHVDVTAQSRRYDGGNSLASYVASTNPTWAAEAAAFVAWRDAVWVYAYAELDKVMAREREVPTVEEFISELPAMVWPEESAQS